jgi:prolyl-tRNA synthetase
MAEKLYSDLMSQGVEVLLDDRKVSPGVKFAEAELLGCPVRVTIGKRSLVDGTAEVSARRGGEEHKFELGSAAGEIVSLLETL